MSRPEVWDLWKKTKSFFTNYGSTLINVTLTLFMVFSILSISHPDLLPEAILWFLNDIFYYYLLEASRRIGSILSWFILLLPNFPSDIPSQENKEWFFHFIIYVIPGFWKFVDWYYIFAFFLADLFELKLNPRDRYLRSMFWNVWLRPSWVKWRKIRYFLSGLGPKVRDNPNELIRWILSFKVSNPNPITIERIPPLPWFRKNWKIRKALWKSTRLVKNHYRYLSCHFREVYFAWNLNPLFNNNHHLASRFFIFCNAQKSFKGERWFTFSCDRDGKVSIFHLDMYRLDNLLIRSSYLEKIEDDKNAETLNSTPKLWEEGNEIRRGVKINFKFQKKDDKGLKALRHNFQPWVKDRKAWKALYANLKIWGETMMTPQTANPNLRFRWEDGENKEVLNPNLKFWYEDEGVTKEPNSNLKFWWEEGEAIEQPSPNLKSWDEDEGGRGNLKSHLKFWDEDGETINSQNPNLRFWDEDGETINSQNLNLKFWDEDGETINSLNPNLKFWDDDDDGGSGRF